MHTKEAVIVLLLVLALCRCCVGGPKRSSKDKGTSSSSTGNLFPAELAKAYNEIANNKQQQPVDNDKLPTPGNPGYAGVQGVQSVTLTDASGKSVTFTKVEQQQQQQEGASILNLSSNQSSGSNPKWIRLG